ncbi:Protein FAR1-RELATED SEQUENCE 5 [Dendrobium catenatum]|uniref:Protein FAR1-RELATED SEQUENCE 5 n=1 Tax=Dendrobium catenatum TaxID=906689 RepID=A0A2I0WH90_9ASPA|nr:Protein FAR1-RELATED SEQUENCE 5 [Dendrobium catenatum]
MVRFVIDEDGCWHVKRFIESHNHELASPVDRHLLRSCRNVVEEKASVLKSMIDAGIRIVNAYAYLTEEVGGCENVGFSKRDTYNFIQKEKIVRIEIGDTNSLIQLFKDQQVEDHMFAWDVQYDDQDRLLIFFG